MKKIPLLKTKLFLLTGAIVSYILMITVSDSYITLLTLFLFAFITLLILPIWNRAQMTRLKYFEKNSENNE